MHHNVSNSLLPLTVFGRESCLKFCDPVELCTRYEIPQFLVYIIRFERILQTRSKNSEKLFSYDLSSEARKKNTFTGLKTPQNCLFSSHLFFRQSWTKVLGHFCVSGAFSNSHRSNPSPHPTNNVGRMYPDFFRISLYRIGGGRTARKSREGCTVLRGNREMTEKYEFCSTVPRSFVQDCRWD